MLLFVTNRYAFILIHIHSKYTILQYLINLHHYTITMKTTLRIALFILPAFAFTSAAAQAKKWTLQECVEYAIKNNISVQQSELDLKLTEIDKKDAWGAYLPSASASAGHSWNIGLTANISGILEQQTTQFTNGGFTAGTPIYNGLANQKRFRRAKMAIIAAQYQLQKIQDDVGLNVANAFLQILFNKENLKVQQEQLAIDIKQQERSVELVEGGTIPRGDLLDIEATVSADRQRVIQAENALLISRLSLAQLLQLDDFKDFDIADEEYDIQDNAILLQSPEEIYNKARTQRNEIKLANANVDVAEQDVKVSRTAFQPTLRAFYSLDTRVTYADYSTFQDNQLVVISPPPFWRQVWDNKGHSYGLQLSIPILNGFSIRNNVERSKIALERSKLNLQQQELDLERNVYTAYTDAQGALRAYEAAVAASKARVQAQTYAGDRYDVGLINVFDFNQAQTLSVNAQSEVLRTKYDYLFRLKILEFYFGLPIFQTK